ncbi:MAG TPA: hypothetical protein VFJ84_01715 [Candidatus Saccharimonadales bacterium]|nr:hypothetical protein [Candidatus Saccharimonadales bacterium]
MAVLHSVPTGELGQPGPRPYEPLAPVLVSANAQEIFAICPEAEELHRLPVDLFDAPILTDEALKSNGVSREERRSRALDPRYHSAAKRAVLSAAHLMSAVPDPSARQEAFWFLVQEWEQDRQVRVEDQTYLRVALNSIDINEGVAYVRAINEHSRPVQQRILEQISDSTANQYGLLKLIASVQSKETIEDLDNGILARDKQAQRWLTLLALVRADRQHTPVAELLCKKLIDGEFDHYIARDMLDYAASYDFPGQPPEPIAALKNMITLVEHSAGVPADGQMLARMAETFSMGLWSKDRQSALYKQRKILQDTLDYLTATVVTEFVSGVVTVEGRDYKAHMYKSFDELADIETDSFIHHAIQVVGETAVSHLKRRHQPRAEEAQAPEEPEEEVTAEREPIPLMCVDNQGNLHDAESPEFIDMVQSYLDKYKNTPHLKEDIDKILGYLSRLNFGNGAISGLIRVTEGYAPVSLNGNGLKPLPVWEFKPKEAQGLSLKSNAGIRTRIYLSVLPGAQALAIRNIGRRTDSNARALNKHSGRRGRRRR